MTAADKATTGRDLAFAGACLQIGPLVANIAVAVDTFLGFRRLGAAINAARAAGGNAAAEALAKTATPQLSAWTIWIADAAAVLGITGLILLLISLFYFRFRARWFFWFLLVYGALLLINFPVYTIVGVVLIIFCLIRKDEFLRR